MIFDHSHNAFTYDGKEPDFRDKRIVRADTIARHAAERRDTAANLWALEAALGAGPRLDAAHAAALSSRDEAEARAAELARVVADIAAEDAPRVASAAEAAAETERLAAQELACAPFSLATQATALEPVVAELLGVYELLAGVMERVDKHVVRFEKLRAATQGKLHPNAAPPKTVALGLVAKALASRLGGAGFAPGLAELLVPRF